MWPPDPRAGSARLPTQALLDQCVVAAPSAHALWGGEVIAAIQLDARDLLDDVDQLVDRDQLTAAEIDRRDDVARHDRLGSEHAVVDVGEAARLLTVAPDLDLVMAREHSRATLRQMAAGAFSRPPI